MAIGQIPRKAKLVSPSFISHLIAPILTNTTLTQSKLIGFKVKVTSTNNSEYIGTLLSFDGYMNIVLSDCEEFRLTKKSQLELRKQTKQKKYIIDESVIKEQKRLLGLVIIRGENIVSVVALAAPNKLDAKPHLRLKRGKGVVKPVLKTLNGARAGSR